MSPSFSSRTASGADPSRSCTCYLSLCAFIICACLATFSRPCFLDQVFHLLWLFTLSASSSTRLSEPWGGRGDIPDRAESSEVPHSAYYLAAGLCICSQLLQKEAYLIVTEPTLIISVTGYQKESFDRPPPHPILVLFYSGSLVYLVIRFLISEAGQVKVSSHGVKSDIGRSSSQALFCHCISISCWQDTIVD